MAKPNARRLEQGNGRTVPKYNLNWPPNAHPLAIEMDMIRAGGQWIKKDGTTAGNGLFFHFKEGIALLWPEFDQHRWFNFFLEKWLPHDHVAVVGPKSSGKTTDAAICHLFEYYCFASETTVIVCSDTKENLEDRIWGEIKKWHRKARERVSWIPGHLIEGRTRLVTDDRDDSEDGRDFRNGMVGIPVKKGNAYVGISAFVGRKNKRVRLCGDELSLLQKAFIDGIASLMAPGASVKVTGMGNPAQTTDALGLLAEPHVSIGGWDGGIDQTPKTKAWKTRWDNGICIQFPGSDSPNMDVPATDPVPYPFLITREQMEKDARTWGKDDWHYLMFDEGRFAKDVGSHRIITRQICLKNHALEEPVWKNSIRTKFCSLDAAYRGVGGDRCVLMTFEYGEESEPDIGLDLVQSIINQSSPNAKKRLILAITDLAIIPIKPEDHFDSVEDQIVMFCKIHCQQRGIPARNFFFDSGMRTALVSAFTRLWSTDVQSIDCGGKPSERPVSDNIEVSCRDYYSKFITELWYSVRLLIEAGQLRGLTEDVMLEGCAREWMTVAGNKIEAESKKEMKEKFGRSPDLFDCLAIGVEGARRLGFNIRRMVNREHVETDWRWKRDLREKAMREIQERQLNYQA